jgi:hypothetical protein
MDATAPSFDNFSVPWSCVRSPERRTKVSSLGARRILAKFEGAIQQTRGGGGEWEPLKILLEGDGDSYKTNTSSNTRL